MAKVKVILNSNGVRELLRSDEMKTECEKKANRALEKLGEGYVVTTYRGRNRINASIKAESNKAIKDNLENNTILKALRG